MPGQPRRPSGTPRPAGSGDGAPRRTPPNPFHDLRHGQDSLNNEILIVGQHTRQLQQTQRRLVDDYTAGVNAIGEHGRTSPFYVPPAQPRQPEPAAEPVVEVGEEEEEEPLIPRWGLVFLGAVGGLIAGFIILAIVKANTHGQGNFAHDSWFGWVVVILSVILGALIVSRLASRYTHRRVRLQRRIVHDQQPRIVVIDGQAYAMETEGPQQAPQQPAQYPAPQAQPAHPYPNTGIGDLFDEREEE